MIVDYYVDHIQKWVDNGLEPKDILNEKLFLHIQNYGVFELYMVNVIFVLLFSIIIYSIFNHSSRLTEVEKKVQKREKWEKKRHGTNV